MSVTSVHPIVNPFERRGADLTHWLAIGALCFVYAAATGRLVPELVPDSQSYLDYPIHSLRAAMHSIRTMGYPLFLLAVDKTVGLRFLPSVHLLIHITSAWMFFRGMLCWQLPRAACWAAALAVAFASTSLDNNRIIATDALAASLGVMTAAHLMTWISRCRLTGQAHWRSLVGAAVLSLAAISVRPAYLAMIVWAPLATILLLTMKSRRFPAFEFRDAMPIATVLGLAIFLPVFAWATARGVVVNDFGILPFGHQNLAGITIQLISDDELTALSPKTQPLAAEIIKAKRQYWEQSDLNASLDPRATMTMEQRWDDYVWYVVVPASDRLFPGDTIASHRAIEELNTQIIRVYPRRCLGWIAKAARRAIWGTAANMLMHPIFLIAFIVAGFWFIQACHRGIAPIAMSDSDGLRALFLVAVTYYALNTALVIMTSPPLGRFIDAAAILIPAWLAAGLINYLIHVQKFAAANRALHSGGMRFNG